jgi:hypothetical protein
VHSEKRRKIQAKIVKYYSDLLSDRIKKVGCEMMVKKKSMAISAILLIVLSIGTSTAVVNSAIAETQTLPPGAEKMYYNDGGGQIEIDLPSPVPPVYPGSATAIRFSFMHGEVPNSNTTFDNMIIWLYVIPSGTTTRIWAPFADITTNADFAAFARTYFKGSFVEFNATLYGLQASYGTDNVFVVPSNVLQVQRNGNAVTVNLNAPQQIKRPAAPAGTNLTVPAFSATLTNYGQSFYFSQALPLTGYLGASEYTLILEQLSYNANGVISSDGFLNNANVENATIGISGTHTYYPPPAYQGVYKEWTVLLLNGRIYVYAPSNNQRFPPVQSIGTWDADYYGRLHWTPVDAAKPYIDSFTP